MQMIYRIILSLLLVLQLSLAGAMPSHAHMSGALFVKASTLEGERTSPLFVKAISQEGYRVTTYNLTVAKAHTFFIGEEQIWVHNVGPCDAINNALKGRSNIKTVTRADASKYGLQKSSGSNTLYDEATGINYVVGKDGLIYEVSSLSGFNPIPLSKPLTSAPNNAPTGGFGPMRRTVDDPNLDNILVSNYGKELINGARVGNGGTADALRYENATGKLLSPNGHWQKAVDMRRRLNDYVRRVTNSPNPNSAGTTFTQRDIDYATELIAD